MRITMELFQIDRVDVQGDLIPMDEAQRLVKNFKPVPVTMNYDPLRPPLGMATEAWIDGTKFIVALELNEMGEIVAGAVDTEAALGATGKPTTNPEDLKTNVLRDMELTEVALTNKKVGYPDEPEQRSSQD